MHLLWLTDLHLDSVCPTRRQRFLGTLRRTAFDAAVITGDISCASRLCEDLTDLGRACAPRLLYFVLGNHDFYDSSFAEVDKAVAAVCRCQFNLKHLGHGEIIPLCDTAGLIGHRGWYDLRAGHGKHSNLFNPDCFGIADLRDRSIQARSNKIVELGKTSAASFRKVLPYALSCYQHVLVATHVPPFVNAAVFSGKQCGPWHLPYYTNVAAGSAIKGIAGRFHDRRVTVLCGHTHSPVVCRASETVVVRVGRATPGMPRVQQVFDVNVH